MIAGRIEKNGPGGWSVQHFPLSDYPILELELEWDSDFGLYWGPWFFEVVFAATIAGWVYFFAWLTSGN